MMVIVNSIQIRIAVVESREKFCTSGAKFLLLQYLWNFDFCLYVIPLHPYIPKIKNSDGGGTLISDVLTQMLVPPFSFQILRKLFYFVFFTTQSL